MLSAVIGGGVRSIGNGKTLFATLNAFAKHKIGYKLISNYDLTFSDQQIKNYEEVHPIFIDGSKRECKDYFHFPLDEGWIYVDCRNGMHKDSLKWLRFFLQTRKAHFDVEITAQHLGQIDIRARRVIDRIHRPQIIVWEGEPVFSKPLVMKLNTLYRNDFGAFVPMKDRIFPIPPFILDTFNTREIIEG